MLGNFVLFVVYCSCLILLDSAAMAIVYSKYRDKISFSVIKNHFQRKYSILFQLLGYYLNWNSSSGLSLRIKVCRLAKRRVCGGSVSSLLCDKSRKSKSVKCMNKEFGILSILQQKEITNQLSVQKKKKIQTKLTHYGLNSALANFSPSPSRLGLISTCCTINRLWSIRLNRIVLLVCLKI